MHPSPPKTQTHQKLRCSVPFVMKLTKGYEVISTLHVFELSWTTSGVNVVAHNVISSTQKLGMTCHYTTPPHFIPMRHIGRKNCFHRQLVGSRFCRPTLSITTSLASMFPGCHIFANRLSDTTIKDFLRLHCSRALAYITIINPLFKADH
jgi:hypothetical protein